MLEALLHAARPLLAPAFTAWGSPVTWLEIVAFVLALAMVAANMRVKPVAWPLAMASLHPHGFSTGWPIRSMAVSTANAVAGA